MNFIKFELKKEQLVVVNSKAFPIRNPNRITLSTRELDILAKRCCLGEEIDKVIYYNEMGFLEFYRYGTILITTYLKYFTNVKEKLLREILLGKFKNNIVSYDVFNFYNFIARSNEIGIKLEKDYQENFNIIVKAFYVCYSEKDKVHYYYIQEGLWKDHFFKYKYLLAPPTGEFSLTFDTIDISQVLFPAETNKKLFAFYPIVVAGCMNF